MLQLCRVARVGGQIVDFATQLQPLYNTYNPQDLYYTPFFKKWTHIYPPWVCLPFCFLICC